ncbi:putative RNA-binding protein [Leptomonas seymouri]|uniref:Putative RNA-binding protein n=1 Tax=Leptomonas seymouri TaxID=5684 RepID=A0A0N1IMQ3_LEPSE|nr:putative RNA-binding protein [Leptomonas seymouri]|eukprot:KPI90413.1 putative RNA-binding protein [Leptomonas seymouri]
MAAPPMPPGKMPPRPPGMKLMPPMPPGFKAPPMPPGKMPPIPPGMNRPGAPPVPPMPPGMAKQLAPAQAGGPLHPRYPVPPGHSGASTAAAPPPPSQPTTAPSSQPAESTQAPRYLMPPGARGGAPEVPTLMPHVMGAPPPPPAPHHRYSHHGGGYGGPYDGGYPAQMGRSGGGRGGRGGRGGDRNFRGGYRGYDGGYERQDRGRRYGARRRDEPQENPPMREATNTVWVGSYDPAFHTRSMLCSAFWPFGRVMQVAVHDGKSYAFVHMRRTEEAKAAVDALMQNHELGPAIFNFSKHHDYTEDEMNLPHDPNVVEEPPLEESSSPHQQHHQQYPPPPSQQQQQYQPGTRRPREQDEHEPRDFRDGMAAQRDALPPSPPPRRARGEREAKDPSNVLWLGNLVPFITNEKLVEIFEVFGPISHVSRLGRSNMAFLTYDTIEQCTMALETMRGRPIEGVMLSMNYGHDAQNNDSAREGGSGTPGAPGSGYGGVPLTADGIPVNETPTNIIYLGNLPSDADAQAIENLFLPFDGFIFSKYVEVNNIGFGHFDSIETARVARAGLMNATVKGSPIRVSFGKQNHSYTMADRRRIGEPAPDFAAGGEFNLDALMRGPGGQLDGSNGALVAGTFGIGGMGGGGALMLPAMGSGGGAGGAAGGAGASVYAKVRPAPEMTLDSRLQSLLGSTYNNCGAIALEISPSQIQAVCLMVDNCVGESSYQTLREALTLYSPLRSVHVFNVVAKRMKEFADDPHKRLLVLYATTHVVLSADTKYVLFTEAVLNAFLMVLLVASEGQTSSGMDRLTSIIESLQQHSFIEKKSSAGKEYEEEFRAQLEDIANRAKAEQDLRSLATRRRRRG